MKITSYIILTFCLFIRPNSSIDCCEMKEGTFDVFEKNTKIGTFYRKNGIQLEFSESENKKYTSSKFTSKDCVFLIKSIKVENNLDTITWKIKKNHYSYIMKPAYLDVNYSLQGEIIKVSNKIDHKQEELIKKSLKSSN
ncbi:hypothetical protein [Kordia sp.]|uniref:hypothetical protein n=1 Tax=Kordia sp. TaxID=1965332 RepID=UPI003B5CE67B